MGELGLRDLLVAYGNGDNSVFAELQGVVWEAIHAEALAAHSEEELSALLDTVMSELRKIDVSELSDEDAAHHRVAQTVIQALREAFLREAVWRLRRGDQDAEGKVYSEVGKIVDKVADRLSSNEGNWWVCEHSNGALYHVLKKLKSNSFDESKCADDRSLKKWIKTTARRYLQGKARRWTEPVVAMADKDMQDRLSQIPDPSSVRPGPNDGQQLDAREMAEGLAAVHAAVSEWLQCGKGAVDYSALYWWFFRARLYTLLRRSEKGARDWQSLLACVEEFCRWDDRVKQLRFRAGWPCIGNLWKKLSPSLEDGANLTADMVIDAARALQAGVTASADQYYQWHKRLMKKLAQFNEDGVLNAIEAAPDAVTLWRKSMLGGETSTEQPENGPGEHAE